MEVKVEKKYGADISSIEEAQAQAQARINSFVHKTLVLSSDSLNVISGRSLFFKCEFFQKGGAFKFRGACIAVLSLDYDEASKGVVTHSRIPAYIVIPRNTPKCKVENVKRYSGQGTTSLEFPDQVAQLDTIIVPISGGGLIAGPNIRIFGAEPLGANDAAQSKGAGSIITLSETNTVAEGLRASLGDLTWPVVQDLVNDVITVEDKVIIEAIRLCYEILKIAVEPSGARPCCGFIRQFQKESSLARLQKHRNYTFRR
ncbi:hypothetical protein Ddye_002629 [Dipteronia dyeriana]|uniref:Tryptophan synthase beta chain-like PALP domain-containing protein n=1 Tax=Dipteronia dyeriana TaxID=168575 RepID=A0AAD9XRI7_9ROSI|nr:hypothetical protein Ddye_002629 [Dipteronia dyeriana]